MCCMDLIDMTESPHAKYIPQEAWGITLLYQGNEEWAPSTTEPLSTGCPRRQTSLLGSKLFISDSFHLGKGSNSSWLKLTYILQMSLQVSASVTTWGSKESWLANMGSHITSPKTKTLNYGKGGTSGGIGPWDPLVLPQATPCWSWYPDRAKETQLCHL